MASWLSMYDYTFSEPLEKEPYIKINYNLKEEHIKDLYYKLNTGRNRINYITYCYRARRD